MTVIETHLVSRGVDLSRVRVFIDEVECVATFPLFNLTGQMVGFQQYRPFASKQVRNDPRTGRYYTHVAREHDHVKKIAVWGLESTRTCDSSCFVVEGIFDAVKIQNENLPALAVLCNDPKHLRPWLRAWNKHIIAVVDSDAAGSKLASIAHRVMRLPSQFKDLGEMDQREVSALLHEFTR